MDFLPIDNRTIGGKHDKWELPKKKEIALDTQRFCWSRNH
jgi:hypothetical protein